MSAHAGHLTDHLTGGTAVPWQPRSVRCQVLRDVRRSGKYLLPNYSHYRRRAIANVLFGGRRGAGTQTGPAHTQAPSASAAN